jgi:5-methylcytosine-specific restriction endonuclease McrA
VRFCPKCREYVTELEHGRDYSLRCPNCRRLWTTTPSPKPEPLVEYSTLPSRATQSKKRRRLNEIGARDGWTCHLCRLPVDADLDPDDLMGPSLDHLVPKSLGGGGSKWNLNLAHRACNMLRGAEPLAS